MLREKVLKELESVNKTLKSLRKEFEDNKYKHTVIELDELLAKTNRYVGKQEALETVLFLMENYKG